ncbi:uncharacterized protein LOC117173686 [Belonocnema kinseyi]|uniref:uncharacterized protein LOC117173686 n=1 Tax=Belonocnema kinseyi TaxID=2817044 RepID=UPI00143D84DE|nr:uncharacterized protein LOC117173686 [Belonocnema kinseyi]
MIQKLWKRKLTWDTPAPVEVQKAWIQYRNELPLLNDLRFDRCIMIPNSTEIQLHGFCDASAKAYGACLYLRSSGTQGNHHCALICSKSRVSPLKTTSLPRLELRAALLLAQLYSATVKSLQLQFSKIYFWSDSTIALNWLNTPPHTLKTFEANRVAEIQEKTEGHEWPHVPTHDNPADLISGGQGPQEFLNNEFWSHGPNWLSKKDDAWPQLNIKNHERSEVRESPPITSLKITLLGTNILERLISRSKWQVTSDQSMIKLGTLVVIKEDNLPPMM